MLYFQSVWLLYFPYRKGKQRLSGTSHCLNIYLLLTAGAHFLDMKYPIPVFLYLCVRFLQNKNKTQIWKKSISSLLRVSKWLYVIYCQMLFLHIYYENLFFLSVLLWWYLLIDFCMFNRLCIIGYTPSSYYVFYLHILLDLVVFIL